MASFIVLSLCLSPGKGKMTMLKAAIKFIRPRILVTCYALVFLGATASGTITQKTALAIFVLIAWYIHAASANDYSDRYIDAVNLKGATDRPLLTKDVTSSRLWAVHLLGGALALLLSLFFGVGAFILTLAMLSLDYAYSIKPVRISDRGILSQFLLAFAYVYYPFSLGFWSAGSNESYPWLLSSGIYLGFVGRLLLKDFRDVKGDKQFGKKTFLLRRGATTTCIASWIFWLIALFIVGYAVSFTLGVLVVFVLGLIQVGIFLRDLGRTTDIDKQKEIVAIIAKSANFTIIAILAFYLCQKESSLSAMELQLIPALIGVILLLLNLFRYNAWKAINNIH